MAKTSQLIRTKNRGFQPFDVREFERVGPGEIITVEWRRSRNPDFHRKFFALVKFIYDQMPEFGAPVVYDGQQISPRKSFDAVRYWLTVKAGYYDVVGLPNGKVRIEPKSVSFAKMDQDEFERLYSAMIDAALEVLPMMRSGSQLRGAVENVLRFDG